MQHASSPGAIDPKIEPLTEEELAMNAITARPKRRKPAAQPDNDTEEDEQAQARGPKKRVPQVVSAPSPISASSPLNAPSPVAPLANERANCAFEQQTGPVLKIERLTPDVRSKLYSSEQPVGSPVPPKQDDDMDYDELLAQEPNEDQEIPASPLNNIPKSTRASTRIRSKPANTVAEAEPSTTTTTRSKPAARSKSAAKSKASKAAAVIAPNDATPKRGTKRKAAVAAGTAVSIGIGVPSVSSSSRITEVDQLEPSADSSSEDDGNNGRRRHRRKRREQGLTRKPHKYAYREVQNLRTLDDITNDPASTDNLDKPMAAFTKDMDGIVSKMFKEMEMVRAEKKKKDEAKTNMTEDELAELKKKEEEDAELEARRKQIAKERDAEKRRREQEGQILAES
jgi:hypothetical protein